MTRINVVPPSELTNKHLVAEYRELPRVFALARPDAKIPPTYRMGAGHVTFFYDKLLWCYERQRQLVTEMIRRGFKPNYPADGLLREYYTKKPWAFNDWEPDAAALAVNRKRLEEKLNKV